MLWFRAVRKLIKISPVLKVGRDPIAYGLNSIGLRRRNFDPKKVAELRKYTSIFTAKG